MESDPFREVVGLFAAVRPFTPYFVELFSKRQYQVVHPEALIISDGLAAYHDLDGSVEYFSAGCVLRVMSKIDPKDEPERNGLTDPF